MAKYKKKNMEVDAVQFNGNNNPYDAIQTHQCDYRMCPLCGGDNHPHAFIRTPMGGYIVSIGDYIVKEANGSIGAYSPMAFAKIYEPA